MILLCWLGLQNGIVVILTALCIWLFFFYTYYRQQRSKNESFLIFLRRNCPPAQKRFIELFGELQHQWMIPLCMLAPCVMLAWANQYFNSMAINTGIVFIYIIPLLTSWLPVPFSIELSWNNLKAFLISRMNPHAHRRGTIVNGHSNQGLHHTYDDLANLGSLEKDEKKIYINLPLICLFFIILGHIMIICSLDILGPNEIPTPTSLFGGFVEVSKDASSSFGQWFFTAVSHSAFYVFGFAWMLFETKMPSFWKQNSNLLLVMFIFVNIVSITFANAPFLSQVQQLRPHFLLFLVYTVYVEVVLPRSAWLCVCGIWLCHIQDSVQTLLLSVPSSLPELFTKLLFLFNLLLMMESKPTRVGSWYWMWIYAQLCKYNGNMAFKTYVEPLARRIWYQIVVNFTIS